MTYIGAQVENRVSPKFLKEDFTGDGSTANFTLTNEVPGGSSQNIMVVVNNVVQEPDVAYTINDDASNLPKILAFTGTPANGDTIYVIHRGIASIFNKPPTGSVGENELATTLKTFTTDAFTGNGSATAFTLSNSASTNDVFVFYNGVAMKPTTDYAISGATLTFTFAPINNSQIMARYFV